MHRFFVDSRALRGRKVVFGNTAARQIHDVLRMKPGELIILLDNTGLEYTVKLTKVDRRQIVGQVLSTQQVTTEPHTQITLFQALTSRQKFEYILQKCTEVGVVRFVPVVTQRSIVRKIDKITEEKLHRWRSIITEAAEQSCRGRIPKLENPITLAETTEHPHRFDLTLVGSPAASAMSLKQILRTARPAPVKIALFIGPEGGFNDSEMNFLGTKGAAAFGLGRRILRTETAATVSSAIILYELD